MKGAERRKSGRFNQIMGASTRETRRRTSVVVMMLLWCCCRSSSFAPTSSAFLGRTSRAIVTRRARPSKAHAAPPAVAVAAPTMKSKGKRAKVKRVWRRSSLHAAEIKDRLGHGVWDKFKVPPDGRAHDEITFRSGNEGRTLTIPQGVLVLVLLGVRTYVLSCSLIFLVESFGRTDGGVLHRSFSLKLRLSLKSPLPLLVYPEQSRLRLLWRESVEPRLGLTIYR